MKFGYLIAGAAVSLMLAGNAIATDIKHFHPKGKPPSKHTVEFIKKARATMNFADKRDFDEQKKGFIAAPDSMKIKAGVPVRRRLPPAELPCRGNGSRALPW